MFFTPLPGEMIQFDLRIFFQKGGEKNTNMDSCWICFSGRNCDEFQARESRGQLSYPGVARCSRDQYLYAGD